MRVDFLDEAEEEFLAAVSRYNSERPGLGGAFATEVTRAIERIEEYPEAWVALSRRTRRCLVNRFSYAPLGARPTLIPSQFASPAPAPPLPKWPCSELR